MKITPNIVIPATLLLSALLLSACASNSKPDVAATSTPKEAVQPDNNFGRDVYTEKTSAPKATPAAASQPATVKSTTKQTTQKAKKKVTKKTDPAAAVAPATK